MQFASIGAQRRNADPAPYLLPDGSRSATDPVDMGNPEHWVTDDNGAAVSLRTDLGTYAPRPEYSPTLHNPANPILDGARDGWDEPWGSAMAWAFACATVLEYLEAPVLEAAGYSPSAWGAEHDLTDGSYEMTYIAEVLNLGAVSEVDGEHTLALYPADLLAVPLQLDAIRAATHALAVLNRYLEAAKAAGLDY